MKYCICTEENQYKKVIGVIPETVGQFTGLTDKNGKEIYEGDIMEDYTGRYYWIEFYKSGFWVNGGQNGSDWKLHSMNNNIKVVGNIHDNPELLTNG
ncbi:putative phage protein (TIGR01671 family) [Dysgonomonas hofstadii]|uniref:Putative phage protein (TIGR01671 family) n=1 Tax=Dysgonomonas hofstadii TaxID=637886 RepID=A0A840CSF0_9BACT|nr:YopX family protein [Dysgonomonas hofstadii]MBB4036574.1 putative phage protein (TIGR01671 family) [Dysgonomonas hofstadii]